MLFAQDDNVHKRGRDVKMPRDNVILEAGAFAQRYGIENVILLVPKDETYLPTDFLGLQTIVFDYMRGADNKDAYRIMKEKISSYMANTIERDNIKTDNVKLKFSEDTDKGISIKGGRIK